MRSRDRAGRAILLTCVVALGFISWGPALADLGSAGDKTSDVTPGRSIPLSAIHDDPDIIPTAAIVPAGSGRHTASLSRVADWRQRLSMVLSAITGAPPSTWTPLPGGDASPRLRAQH
jgi:hypothetical protein